MPSGIVRMCHGGDWVDTCSMHFPYTHHLSFRALFVRRAAAVTCFFTLVAFLRLEPLVGRQTLRHVVERGSSSPYYNPWVQGGTVKPALTQPWGLRDVPEHLIWAVCWPLESFTDLLTPGVC